MLAVQFARQNQLQIFSMVLYGSNMYNRYYSLFAQRLPLEIGVFHERALLRFLALSILRDPLSWPFVYVPFISPYLFPAKQYNLLRLLNKIGMVRFYDDGIGAMSLQTAPWKMNYITCSPEEMISWDYRFLWSTKQGKNMVSISQSYDFFVEQLVGPLEQCRPFADSQSDSAPADGRKKDLIIASKWIDWSVVIDQVGEANVFTATYLPHCVSEKNNQFLLENAACWSEELPPELILPRVLNGFATVFFGVTSTVPYVIEVMLSMALPIHPLFVVAINDQQASSPGEAKDFTDKILYYQRQHQLRVQVVGAD